MSHDSPAFDAAKLDKNAQCDTVVVGAGIAGLSTAYELASAGQRVIILDRGRIAGGMTARTTAHLAPVCDDGVAALIKVRGEATARLFQQSQEAAVDRIAAIVDQHVISCNFRRLDAYLFPAPGMHFKAAREQQDEEYKALRSIEADVSKERGVPLKGYETAPVIRYKNQATFHPLKYLSAVIACIQGLGGELYADSPVMEAEERATHVILTLDSGIKVVASNVVFATNSPVCGGVELHNKMAPYRTYAMAFTIRRGTLPDALYWDMADPYHYVRLQPGPGTTDYLIAGGADHKSGEADDGAVRFEAIEAWIRELVPFLGREVSRWSGQVLDTIDYCGFIGRDPNSQRTFIATGDSGQGITHGALAGMLLKQLVVDGSSPWTEVYDPSRKPVAGILNYVRENVTAIKNFAEYLLPAEIENTADLQPGQGGVMREGLAKIAVCRDLNGELHACSAVCTHLECHLHWNTTEQGWDCPCHGSQFSPSGQVMNGPALVALSKHTLPSV